MTATRATAVPRSQVSHSPAPGFPLLLPTISTCSQTPYSTRHQAVVCRLAQLVPGSGGCAFLIFGVWDEGRGVPVRRGVGVWYIKGKFSCLIFCFSLSSKRPSFLHYPQSSIHLHFLFVLSVTRLDCILNITTFPSLSFSRSVTYDFKPNHPKCIPRLSFPLFSPFSLLPPPKQTSAAAQPQQLAASSPTTFQIRARSVSSWTVVVAALPPRLPSPAALLMRAPKPIPHLSSPTLESQPRALRLALLRAPLQLLPEVPRPPRLRVPLQAGVRTSRLSCHQPQAR